MGSLEAYGRQAGRWAGAWAVIGTLVYSFPPPSGHLQIGGLQISDHKWRVTITLGHNWEFSGNQMSADELGREVSCGRNELWRRCWPG